MYKALLALALLMGGTLPATAGDVDWFEYEVQVTDQVATEKQALEAIKGFIVDYELAEKQMSESLSSYETWKVLNRKYKTLLKHAVVLESYYENASMQAVLEERKRDIQGVSSGVGFSRRALGNPGTSVNDDILEASARFSVDMMVYYTVRSYDKFENPQFDLNEWLAKLGLEIPLV